MRLAAPSGSRAIWTPASIESFEAAVTEGALEERHDFDAKRELPHSGKELAKDIAAMSTDGGALIYGVGEDENGQPRILAPFELAGAAERIDQIAQQSISGKPRVEFTHLRLSDEPGRGYLVASVPPSPVAPHQVTVGDDRRFYGRCETGNRRLSEEEIARLYERRHQLDVDREALLGQCVAGSPLGQPRTGEAGFLQAFVQPALREDDLWDRAVTTRGAEEQVLLKGLRDAVASVPSRGWGGAHLGLAPNWHQSGADKFSLDTGTLTEDPDALPARRRALADLSMDGRCYLFYGGAADCDDRGHNTQPPFMLYERGIALNLAQFLALVGELYGAGGQHGFVDIGVAVTGIRGAVSAEMHSEHLSSPPYGDEGAYRTLRCDARELCDDPLALAQGLLERLWRAMSGGHSWNPLSTT